MARNTDPFTPHGPLDHDLLERYIQGLLSPEECREVELHLERDPLLRDAVEGLKEPGALEAARSLRRSGPANGNGRWPIRILAGAAALGGLLFFLWQGGRGPKEPTVPADTVNTSRPTPLHSVLPAEVESTLQVVDRELEAVTMQPADHREHEPTAENFRQPSTESPTVIREYVDRLEVQPTTIDHDPDREAARKPVRDAHSSRQLVFLHGLKLVHPSELAQARPHVQGSSGRPADAEQAARDRLPAEPESRPYLNLMDEAMGAFAHQEYRAALDEFYFILSQNPDDVNAQFYAGLACYHLGLYPRAAQLLREAARNPVDSFNEEAEWYGALTLERLEGSEAAKPTLERIARDGGFYAEQARGRLGR